MFKDLVNLPTKDAKRMSETTQKYPNYKIHDNLVEWIQKLLVWLPVW